MRITSLISLDPLGLPNGEWEIKRLSAISTFGRATRFISKKPSKTARIRKNPKRFSSWISFLISVAVACSYFRADRGGEFLKTRLIPQRVEHRVKPEQCRRERGVA
jgi:hypothetical protein